mmetsp:Transcript_47272/g.96595  ORF Transcript_47272/g.96595 Transcript_47272/m.96595 type:complete len:526 (+) Transcript_47272:2-1579(+)
MAFVPVEIFHNYVWFFRCCKEGFGDYWDKPGIVLVTDRCKGLMKSIHQELPNVHHFFCFWHIMRNLRAAVKGVGTEVSKLCWNVQKSTTLQEFEYNMDELQKKHKGAAKYLNKLGDTAPGLSQKQKAAAPGDGVPVEKQKAAAPGDRVPVEKQTHGRPGIPGAPIPVTSKSACGSSSSAETPVPGDGVSGDPKPNPKPGHKHWCWAHALHAGHSLDGVRTSNYAEQENNRFLPSRWKHPLYFLLDFALVFTRLVSDQIKLSKEMEESQGQMKAIMPAIQAKYKEAEKQADEYKEITQTGPTSGTVAKNKQQITPPRSLHLDVEAKDRCSCRQWMNLGWPCRHGIALSRFFKRLHDIILYVQFSFKEVFQSRRWARTFNSEEFHQPVFVGLEDVLRDDSDNSLKAPKVVVKRGAHRVKRMGAAEGGTKCSKAEKERQEKLAAADAPSDDDDDSDASVDPDKDPEQDLDGDAPEEEDGENPEQLAGVRVPSPEPGTSVMSVIEHLSIAGRWRSPGRRCRGCFAVGRR